MHLSTTAIEYKLRPATEADIATIIEISHSYFPFQHHDDSQGQEDPIATLHRNVSEMLRRGCGFFLNKVSEDHIRDNLNQYLVLDASTRNNDDNDTSTVQPSPPHTTTITTITATTIGYIWAYRASFLDFDSHGTAILPFMHWNDDANDSAFDWKEAIGAHPDTSSSMMTSAHYNRFYINQIALRQEWLGKGAARCAYEQLFANAHTLFKLPKESPQPQPQQQVKLVVEGGSDSAQTHHPAFTVFFCFVVVRPFENARSLRFHTSSACGFKQIASLKLEDYNGLKDLESVLLAKVVEAPPPPPK